MTNPMLRLILDFLWRAKWRWLPPALIYFMFAMTGRVNPTAGFTMLPFAATLLSLTLLVAIFDRNSLAVISDLPLSRRQLGRVFWWAAIAIPTMLTACILNPLAFSAAETVFKRGRKTTLTLAPAPEVPLWEWGVLVFASLAIAMALAMYAGRIKRTLAAQGVRPWRVHLAAIKRLLLLPFVMLVAVTMARRAGVQDELAWTPILIAGVIVAAMLYARAELIVDWRMQTEVTTNIVRSTATKRTMLHGWLSLSLPFLRLVAICTACTLLLFVLPIAPKDSLLVMVSGLATGVVIPWIGTLRPIRTLPIAAPQLAAILIGFNLLPSAIIWLLVYATKLLYVDSPHASLSLLLFFLPLQSLALPILLRFGSHGALGRLMVCPVILAPAFHFLFDLPRLPAAFMQFGWISIVVSYVWSKHELRRLPRADTGSVSALHRHRAPHASH